MMDYRVTVKVRNNRILKAIEESGGQPGMKWCEANHLPYGTVNDLINMTVSPILNDGSLSKAASLLCDVLNKLPEDLWSADQLYPLEKNFAELEMSQEQVAALMYDAPALPDESMRRLEQSAIVQDVVLSLTPRQQQILNMRYQQDKTYEEIAELCDCSRARVVQIERQALGRLRKGDRCDRLADCLEDEALAEEVRRARKDKGQYQRYG